MAMPVFGRRSAGPIVPTSTVERVYRKDLSKLERLPMFPDTALRAMSLANHPGTAIGEMATLIRRDGVMTAAMIKAANRNVSRESPPVADVAQAVTRLGINGCAAVVASLGMHHLADSNEPHVRDACDTLRRHGLFVAHLCEALNEALNLSFRGKAYTAGLLHDVGRVIGFTKSFDSYQAADPLDFAESEDTIYHERSILDTDHCAIGHLFAYTNRLPTIVADAIQHHHDPRGSREHAPFVALVALADDLANYLHRERSLTGYELGQSPGYALLAENVASSRRDALPPAIPKLVAQALKETKAMIRVRG